MPKSQLKVSFLSLLSCALICLIGLIAQILFSETFNIEPIYFEYLVYVGNVFFPLSIIFFALTFSNTKFKFKKKYLLLFVVPIISLLVLWTNDFHHLFYKEYSIYLDKSVSGAYAYVYTSYTYILFFIGLAYLIRYSIKNSGLFSKQSLLFTLGCLCPLIVNICGFFRIFTMTVYITNIAFTIGIMFFALAIFKFGFLKITPIALKKIVDRMSDSYLVLNDDLDIVDYNKTFLKTFNIETNSIINKNFIDLTNLLKDFKSISTKVQNAVKKTKNSDNTIVIDKYFTKTEKYFHIEINSISDNTSHLGTLLLFKDVTQHKLDLQTIENNQEIIIEKERLASLGQMIGGIAHNLKTPIMSISGASEGLLDLIREYSSSIGDPEVTKDDHLEIAGEMEEWITKIKSHLAYMSDVITAVKGQAVAFSDSTSFTSFTIDDLVRQVDILMKHELSHSLVTLEKEINIKTNTVVKGNINSLVQVLNNMISNSIQAYNGKEGEKIILGIYKEKNNIVFKIQDYAGGILDSVKDKLFKQMATTKGKNGTGLGLFMSYSNIKAHFNGNIHFDTKQGKGTTFYIEIPN